ncbi:hypothetical protein NBRC116188_21630 [Oceaniserpentilla sp. 4NH20-0058]|uniref:serine protease n=1 Tax=Oceaniserpentilla sp. 4NH20-0058 TaxID=3127660 RepID=UPI0031027C4D
MKYFLFILFLTLSTISHSQNYADTLNGNIIGGSEAEMDYPWLASIQKIDGHFCAGILIHENFLLTAAHCLYGIDKRDITVNLGGNNKDIGVETHQVDWIILHEKFQPETYKNDIALIKLHSKSALEVVQIWPDIELKQNDKLTILGWGLTNAEDAASLSSKLLEVDVSYQADSICQDTYQIDDDEYWDYALCAGELLGGKDSCSGDSGGPIISQYQDVIFLIGLVSWGIGCGLPEYYGVYTEVGSYIGWVQSKINQINIVGESKLGFLGEGARKNAVLKIINPTTDSVDVNEIYLAGVDNQEFEVNAGDESDGHFIPSASVCDFQVSALGGSLGEHQAELIFEDDNVTAVHSLNSKVLKNLINLSAYLPWPFYSGTKSSQYNPNNEHSEPWYGVNLGEGVVALKSGQITQNERSVLLTYVDNLNNEELYFRFDAKISAEFPTGVIGFVNENPINPVALDDLTTPLYDLNKINTWHTYQLPLQNQLNHVMLIFFNLAENSETEYALIKNPRICDSASQDEGSCIKDAQYFPVIATFNNFENVSDCQNAVWPKFLPYAEKDSAGATKSQASNEKKSSGGSMFWMFFVLIFLRNKKTQPSSYKVL